MTQMSLCTKQKHTDLENRLVVSKCKRGRDRMKWEFRVSRCKLLCMEWRGKILQYSTGNTIQCPVINHNGKECKKECIYICMAKSLCCTAEN